MTDWLLARELANRVAAALPVLVAPVVCFGFYPAFVRYPGSQHLSAATFSALLGDLLGKLIADGAHRIAVINTGVSTEGTLDATVRELYAETGVRISVAHISRLGRRAEAGLEQKLGGHGDEAETSMNPRRRARAGAVGSSPHGLRKHARPPRDRVPRARHLQ